MNNIKKKNIKYTLYKNIPELSKYDTKLNFNLENINENLNNKIVCFIHFTNVGNGYEIFMDQINNIKKSNLYNKLDYIFVIMIGPHKYLPQDYKIKIIYYSENIQEWELPCIQRIKYFSDNICQNIKILYLHTKEVLNKPCAYEYEWRKYLEYNLVENHELCLNLLDKYYSLGVNQQFYFDNENIKRNHFFGNFWWSNSNYIKKLPYFINSEDRYFTEHYLIGDLSKTDYRYTFSLHHINYDLYKIPIQPIEYNYEIIKINTINNLQNKFIKNRKIFGLYFICCIGNYYKIVQEQILSIVSSGLYDITDKIYCFICNYNKDILNVINKYDKFIIISTNENLYEKYAINNYKKYINDNEYYLYYFHSKSVSRQEKYYNDWRILCDYFTLTKWRLSIELLKYYDCVGTNMKQFPKIHYSGNYWWSKSEHLNKLYDIDDKYLSPEMYIMSYMKTNKICIYQSNDTHGNTKYDINFRRKNNK